MTNEYGLEEIQKELLDIMKIFHNFCEEKGIRYFLFGGSCLGAVRHKGFIPWDGDMDVCVDWNNYNKLAACFDECEGLNMHMTLWVDRVQKDGTVNVQGCIPTLDVFVIDNAPDNSVVFRMKILLLSALQGMLKERVPYEKFSFKYKVLSFVTHMMGKLFSTKTLLKKYGSVSQIGNKKPTKYVHCANTGYNYISKKFPADTWNEALLTDFEDAKFYIPAKFDVCLKTWYGDYMKLPDEAERWVSASAVKAHPQ